MLVLHLQSIKQKKVWLYQRQIYGNINQKWIYHPHRKEEENESI